MTIKKLTISVFRLVVRDSPPDPGGGGGGDSHIKITRVFVGSFEKKHYGIPRSCFWAWLEMFFFPLRRYHLQLLHNTLFLVIFSARYLKRY